VWNSTPVTRCPWARNSSTIRSWWNSSSVLAWIPIARVSRRRRLSVEDPHLHAAPRELDRQHYPGRPGSDDGHGHVVVL
jgi:hypothetical protein